MAISESFSIPVINIPPINIPAINISPVNIPAINIPPVNIPTINTNFFNWDSNSILVTASTGNIQAGSPGADYSLLSTSQVLGQGTISIQQSFNNVNSLALLTGLGNDTLTGTDGTDLLVGGMGNDSITTGAGTDSIAFRTAAEGIDTITDFSVTDDKIVISASGFAAGLIPPPQGAQSVVLPIEQFAIGSAPTNESVRFLYDPASGGLFFDADGNGSGGQIQFAQLSAGQAFTHQNIQVIN